MHCISQHTYPGKRHSTRLFKPSRITLRSLSPIFTRLRFLGVVSVSMMSVLPRGGKMVQGTPSRLTFPMWKVAQCGRGFESHKNSAKSTNPFRPNPATTPITLTLRPTRHLVAMTVRRSYFTDRPVYSLPENKRHCVLARLFACLRSINIKTSSSSSCLVPVFVQFTAIPPRPDAPSRMRPHRPTAASPL